MTQALQQDQLRLRVIKNIAQAIEYATVGDIEMTECLICEALAITLAETGITAEPCRTNLLTTVTAYLGSMPESFAGISEGLVA